MTESIRWDLYRTLLAVLEEGSLSAAARSLGLTQPTVGRHITELEDALQQSLFTRSQTGLIPTTEALALQADAQAMRNMAAALERSGKSLKDKISGPVRISASEVVGVEILPPILATIQAQYPKLELELMLSNKLQDLARREVDIAVRMAVPTQEVLLATRVGELGLGFHAHQHYLKQHGLPASLDDLKKHVLIGYDRPSAYVRAASSAYPWWTREAFSLRTDSDLAQLALIRSGAGIGICQTELVRHDPNIIHLLADQFSLKLTTWVVMNEGLRHSAAYLTTFKGLVQGLRDYTNQAKSAHQAE